VQQKERGPKEGSRGRRTTKEKGPEKKKERGKRIRTRSKERSSRSTGIAGKGIEGQVRAERGEKKIAKKGKKDAGQDPAAVARMNRS